MKTFAIYVDNIYKADVKAKSVGIALTQYADKYYGDSHLQGDIINNNLYLFPIRNGIAPHQIEAVSLKPKARSVYSR